MDKGRVSLTNLRQQQRLALSVLLSNRFNSVSWPTWRMSNEIKSIPHTFSSGILEKRADDFALFFTSVLRMCACVCVCE